MLLMIASYQLVLLWVRSAAEDARLTPWYLLPSISSAVIWPWLMIGLRFLRRYFRVV